jgi:hypothetical protein
MTVLGKMRKTKNPATLDNYAKEEREEWGPEVIKMPESFIATVQKLRRVAIPPNISKLYNIKEGDQVRVTVELVSSVQKDGEKNE